MKAVDQVMPPKSQLGPNQELNHVELPHWISDFLYDSRNKP